MPGSASARISEPSRRDSGRSFHSRGPTEPRDLSPTVRSLNNGIARHVAVSRSKGTRVNFLVKKVGEV